MWGLTLDTIQSIIVVTANGSIITASSTQHSDLFWVRLLSVRRCALLTHVPVRPCEDLPARSA